MLLPAGQNRAFGYAAAASLALHALVLSIQLPALRKSLAPPPEPPLVARLVAPVPAPAPAPAPVAPAPPQAKAEEQAQLPPRRQPHRPRKQQARPAPRPAPLPAPPAPPPREPVEAGVSQGELAAPAAPPPAAAVAPAPRDPAAALGSFRQRLVDLAARHKRYPRVALDNGWTGGVVVRVDVAAGGEVTGVTVKTSSGYAVLDEQALEMFRKAAAEVRVPADLRGQPFSVEVRAIYDLRDRPG